MKSRKTAVLAVTASVALGLAGCALPAPPEQGALLFDAGTSETVSPPTAETPAADGDGAAPTDEPAGSAAAPVADWPSDVPVPDAEFAQDISIAGLVGAAFSVDDAAAVDAYAAQLEAAGFSEVAVPGQVGEAARAFQDESNLVAVTFVEAGGLALMSVAIQPL